MNETSIGLKSRTFPSDSFPLPYSLNYYTFILLYFDSNLFKTREMQSSKSIQHDLCQAFDNISVNMEYKIEICNAIYYTYGKGNIVIVIGA